MSDRCWIEEDTCEELKKYTEEEIDQFFEDEVIEFDLLQDFLIKIKDQPMKLDFDGSVITIKLGELEEL